MAATPTMTTQTTPARTPSVSQVMKSVLVMLQMSISVMITISVTMADDRRVGPLVDVGRAAPGSSRSNDQANSVRIGMNVLPTIAGRLQKRNEPTIRNVSTGRCRRATPGSGTTAPVGMA